MDLDKNGYINKEELLFTPNLFRERGYEIYYDEEKSASWYDNDIATVTDLGID